MKYKNTIKNSHKVFWLAIFSFFTTSVCAQTKIQLPYKEDVTSATLRLPDRKNGFRISLSLVAIFTTGAEDRNGFRIGTGLSLGYDIGAWSLTTGIDAYKAAEGSFGMGTSYAGLIYYDGQYGGSYYLNRYYQGGKQTSAIVGARIKDFQFRFEDDILALPFAGFKIYDRFRTAALEIQYRDFLIGANVYTSDINGITDVSKHNSKGIYADGRQVSSPIYVGYTTRGLVARYGINSRAGGIVGQNGWHRLFFQTPDFKERNYKNQFLQFGVNKPYTLY